MLGGAQAGSRIRPTVLAARKRLADGRETLRRQHDSGTHGVQVCSHLTDLVDTILLELYHSALAELDDDARSVESAIALVPHGGYGRRDLVPFSDVDLMLLWSGRSRPEVEWLANRLVQDLCDAGFQLGFSTRTPAEACAMSLKDATIFTSLVESRFLAGSVRLFTRFFERFRRNSSRRCRTLISSILKARNDERRQYGETPYLLEPNVKRSQGALRDIHLLRWIGFARYGECTPTNQMRSGCLARVDRDVVRSAREFLLRLRNEMHFHAGQAKDVLLRPEQVRIASTFGYTGDEGVLPVEAFMRDYFHHTSEIGYVMEDFIAAARRGSGLLKAFGPLLSHRSGREYSVGPMHISATRYGRRKLNGDLSEVMRLMRLSNEYLKWIDHETWTVIRDSVLEQEMTELPPKVASHFLDLMARPGRLADLLRRLHRLRVLEKLVPAMSHARCLMQFNDYHKYTVDEHSFRAVEAVTDFIGDSGPLGEAYRSVRQKRTLHLAALIHDLGKGFNEDHSEVGRRLADETARHLGLPQRESETLQFLVHKHLLLSHLAQRRDISDPQVALHLAMEAGSPDVLRMLYVLTCADLAAVGPGVLNDWKKELITKLYFRAVKRISEGATSESERRQQQGRRAALLELTRGEDDPGWWWSQVEVLPENCLFYDSQERLVEQLRALRQLPEHKAEAWGRFLPDHNAVEYTVAAHEKIAPGIFHRLTGALTSKGHQILTAEINTLARGVVLDRFFVHDKDHVGEPPGARIDEVRASLVSVLENPTDKPPTFRRIWGDDARRSVDGVKPLATRVHFDNDTSHRFTIIDIYATDRMGLLYTITNTLYELGLSVGVAKIGTYLDQVVDVFYVTDFEGRKIEDDGRIAEIRGRLLAAIEPSS